MLTSLVRSCKTGQWLNTWELIVAFMNMLLPRKCFVVLRSRDFCLRALKIKHIFTLLSTNHIIQSFADSRGTEICRIVFRMKYHIQSRNSPNELIMHIQTRRLDRQTNPNKNCSFHSRTSKTYRKVFHFVRQRAFIGVCLINLLVNGFFSWT